MHDLQTILQSHLDLSAQRHGPALLRCLEYFANGTGDTAKAKELIDKVYAPVRAAVEKPVETGPHEYVPMSNRAADGLVIKESPPLRLEADGAYV